ncbi:MAG: DoxX family protein [Parachlamydia sp.]|nr:MAG: DoxX family protein [Parachlamydia sp.]
MQRIRNFFDDLNNWGIFFQNFLLLAIRLFWGYGFFLSGYGKLINIDSTTSFFSSLGFPFPQFSAYLAGSIECIGGALLLIGLLSRLSSLFLMATMIVAYLTAHFASVRNLLEDPQNFFDQAPFLFLYAAVIVFCFGPGKISLDALIERLFSRKSD